MPDETIILDERLDASGKDVEKLVSDFFAQYVALPLGIDIDIETNGDIQFWVIKPENRCDGINEKLINGYIEISGISSNPNRMPIGVRIASYRPELNLLWLELGNYIKSSLLIPDFPPSLITGQITKEILLGTSKPAENILPESSLQGFTPDPKKLIDDACIGWANRGYLPSLNMTEFLQEFEKETNRFLTIDQFKDALKDAGKRGLIVKIKKRWRSPENTT